MEEQDNWYSKSLMVDYPAAKRRYVPSFQIVVEDWSRSLGFYGVSSKFPQGPYLRGERPVRHGHACCGLLRI